MHNEGFYTTAAQLLAVFAIALLVILPGLWRRQSELLREANRKRLEAACRYFFPDIEKDDPFLGESLEGATQRWAIEIYLQEKLYRAAQCAAVLFLAGEASTLTVLLLGAKSWIVLLAGPIAFTATMALAALTVFIAFRRLPDKPRVDGLLPSTDHINRVRAGFGWPSLREQNRINRNPKYRRPDSSSPRSRTRQHTR